MTPLEFLAAVLPPPGHGYYCVAELNSARKEHVFTTKLDEIKPAVKKWLSRQRDVYFALATYENRAGGRKVANAQFVKSLFIDMDGYASKKEAATELLEFLERTGLDQFGTPIMVGSGGGLHCYWPLTTSVLVEDWKPVAEMFKRLCKQEGLSIDMTVTADAARVLRVPNTLNFKKKYGEPRPVKVLMEGDAVVDLKRFSATIRGLLTEAIPTGSNFVTDSIKLEGTRPSKSLKKKSALTEALAGSSVTRFKTIWLKTERGAGCAQLDYFHQNAQDDGMEPLWRGILSWTKVCEDGDEFSRKVTALHPYEESRMHQKLSEIKGPYPCVKMDSENPGVCTSCQYWGTITNPLALGREVAVDNAPKQLEVPVQGADPSEPEYEEATDGGYKVSTRLFERPEPPKGFDYGANGGIYATVSITDNAGNVSKIQVPVLHYDLFVVDVLRMEERELYAHLLAIRPVGEANDEGVREKEYVQIMIPQKAAVSKDELLKHLATHGVLAAGGQVNDASLYAYVRGAIQKATQMKKAISVPNQFGWQKNGDFVYGNRVFCSTGEVFTVPMPGLENINRASQAKGTLDGWQTFWKWMIRTRKDTMLAMCLDAFGSVLMHFSNQDGFVWHIGSTQSGTGKSLTLTAKEAVWGQPKRWRVSKNTSPVALQQRAGLLGSLPLLIDEITAKSRNDMEWVPTFIFDMAEGQGKERMEAGANKERLNTSTWGLTCTLTSNTHIADILLGTRKHSSHGEAMRMLEWNPHTPLSFTEDDRAALEALNEHYGVAGELFVRYIVSNRAKVQRIWHRVHAHLAQALGFTDEERYWHAACTCTVAAAALLSSNHAGILDVPVERVIQALRGLVEQGRTNNAKAVRTAEDILNEYTRENYGQFVIVYKGDQAEAKMDLGLDARAKDSTRQHVRGRIEIDLKNQTVDYYVELQLLRQHCAAMSFGFADFKRQITSRAQTEMNQGRLFLVNEVRKNMLAGTNGPSLMVNTMHIKLPRSHVDDEGLISLG